MRNDPNRLLIIKACQQHFSLRLREIPVFQAARILKALGYGDKSFWWVNRDAKRRLWTAHSIAETEYGRAPAWSINPVKFMGGPPAHMRLQVGTLFTFLMDRILREVADDGLQSLDGVVGIDEVYA